METFLSTWNIAENAHLAIMNECEASFTTLANLEVVFSFIIKTDKHIVAAGNWLFRRDH